MTVPAEDLQDWYDHGVGGSGADQTGESTASEPEADEK